MAAFPTTDLALAFDAARFRADAVIADGDLVLAETPVTPILMALGADRRAAPDDTLPTGVTPLNAPSSWSERRGWCLDCLDRGGRLAGSRLWLLDREKATEEVRQRAEIYAAEALAWMKDEYGLTPELFVTLERADTNTPWLQIVVRVDGRSVTYVRKLAA